MTTENRKVSRILGVAFLLQFVTSFSSGVLLQPAGRGLSRSYA